VVLGGLRVRISVLDNLQPIALPAFATSRLPPVVPKSEKPKNSPEHCPNCGGALKIIAAIEDPPVIVKILSHLGLPTRAPPRAPARRVDLFQTI
jgi:hypothetical protein